MNDRELLELAAKAVGIDWCAYAKDGSLCVQPSGKHWNPLTDDGDAMRLAVYCGICITFASLSVYTVGHSDCNEMYGGDPYAATRRAIVRAAAEMGKSLCDASIGGVK